MHKITKNSPDKNMEKFYKVRSEIAIASILSAIVIVFCLLICLAYYGDANMLSGLGQLLGAAASSIAFIWLLVSINIQSKSLFAQAEATRLQTEEIKIQQEALKESVSAKAIELYVSIIRDAEKSLDRYCRSIILCVSPTHFERLSSSSSFNGCDYIFAEEICNNEDIVQIIKKHVNNPIIKNLCLSYCELYNELINVSKKYSNDTNIITMTIKSTSFEKVKTIMDVEILNIFHE